MWSHRNSLCNVCVLLLTAALFDGPVIGKPNYGVIQPPPGPVLEKLAEQDGALFRWLGTFEGIPVYADQNCTQRQSKISFLSEYFELWRNDTVVLLTEGKVGSAPGEGVATDVVGYAKLTDLIMSQKNLYMGLRAQNRISKKALVVHRWDQGTAVTEVVGLRHVPDPTAPTQGDVKLYDILYVYAMKGDPNDPNGFCFVGNRPNCEVGDLPTRQKCFLGWLPNNRIFFWDHREGVEFNKSPEARTWRSDNKRPIQFFADESDIKANRSAITEDLGQGPWKYYMQRFPIISQQPRMIDGVPYLPIGVIGDSRTGSGDIKIEKQLEDFIHNELQAITENLSNLEVLFVIDATGSMSRYFPSIKEAVARIREGLEKGREKPLQYAVLYYRDYTEENERDSFVYHFVDSRSSRDFARDFPDGMESKGGQDNPPPFYGIDTAVKKRTWQKDSMRAVILIGDMGNEQPDKRGFTVDSVVKTLQDYRCEFFAIQAQSDQTSDRRVALFNSQAEEIANKLGMPEAKVFNADGSDVSEAIINGIQLSDTRRKVLLEVLHKIENGEPWTDAIQRSLHEIGIDWNPSAPSKSTAVSRADSWGTHIEDTLLKRLPPGIDPKLFRERRVQHFGVALAPQQIPGCSYPSFNTQILMLRADFQQLAAVIGTVVKSGVNQGRVSEVWRQVVNQLSGDLDQEIVFDETRPLSEYMMMALGIPVHSELLKKSVAEIKAMDQEEIAKFREELDALWQKMNNYDNDMTVDGTATEPHWFLMHTQRYAWVPIELMP